MYHGPETLRQLEAFAKQRGLLMQGAGGRVEGVRKLSRALVQRVRKVVYLLVDKVKDARGINGWRVRQRGQERIPKDGHNIVVQDPATVQISIRNSMCNSSNSILAFLGSNQLAHIQLTPHSTTGTCRADTMYVLRVRKLYAQRDEQHQALTKVSHTQHMNISTAGLMPKASYLCSDGTNLKLM